MIMNVRVSKSGRRLVGALAVAALVVASFSVRSGGHVRAQSDPGCEDPDTVACIPAPDNSAPAVGADPAGGAAPGAPRAAAAAPGPQPYPYPYCPVPVGTAPPQPAAAPPGPPPNGVSAPIACYADVFSTINRANLAYARAMRALDSSQLRVYWGQDALQDLLNQIAALRYSGSYRVLRLASIQVLEQSIGPNYAWVHTSEHWFTSTWSYAGYQYDSSDSWYDNQYYLYRVGGRWVIGSDVVN